MARLQDALVGCQCSVVLCFGLWVSPWRIESCRASHCCFFACVSELQGCDCIIFAKARASNMSVFYVQPKRPVSLHTFENQGPKDETMPNKTLVVTPSLVLHDCPRPWTIGHLIQDHIGVATGSTPSCPTNHQAVLVSLLVVCRAERIKCQAASMPSSSTSPDKTRVRALMRRL